MKNKFFPQVFIIYLRYLIGFAFVFASIVKIQGLRFTTESGAGNPINSAWHFFETLYQSGLYWKFLGIGQMIAGFLLLTQRYAKLGAVLFFPIIANIFVITISYDFRGTPLITGSMLLANILLILWDWDSLRVLVNRPPKVSYQKRLENDSIWMQLGLLFFVLTISAKLVVNDEKILLLFAGLFLLGIAGCIIGYQRRKRYHMS